MINIARLPFLGACLVGGLNGQSVTYNYTGGEQYYIVPAGVYALQVNAWGGGGGGGFGSNGGGAGYAASAVNVNPGQVVTIRVGGGGRYSSLDPSTSRDFPVNYMGVYGGGGDTWVVGNGGQGGGRTEVDVGPATLVVAGGGGGSDSNTGNGVLNGGAGGTGGSQAGRDGQDAGTGTGGGGGGGLNGGAAGTFSTVSEGGSSGVTGSGSQVFFSTVYESGSGFMPGAASSYGYGGASTSDGLAGGVIVAPFTEIISSPDYSSDTQWVYDPYNDYYYPVTNYYLLPGGSALLGVQYTEATLWKDGQFHSSYGQQYGANAFNPLFAGELESGNYSYQQRTVDNAGRYVDGRVDFYVP